MCHSEVCDHLVQYRGEKEKKGSFRQDFFRLKNLILSPGVFLEEAPETGKWWEHRKAESQSGEQLLGNPKSEQGCALGRNSQHCDWTRLF